TTEGTRRPVAAPSGCSRYTDRPERLRVRIDEPSYPLRPSTRTRPHRSVRFRAPAWTGPAALAALVAVTSLALAVFASAWLVPPYLALMALVLGFPNARREPARERSQPTSGASTVRS